MAFVFLEHLATLTRAAAVVLIATMPLGAAAETPVEGGLQPPDPVAADGTRSVVVATPPETEPAEIPVRPADASLDGPPTRPLGLLEALFRSGDRSRRLWITQAYWKLAANVALVRSAGDAVGRLDLVAPGAEPHARAVLDAAIAEAQAELAEARADLVVAQQELVDLIRLPLTEPLPIPLDRPLTAAYQTHFDTIFANRPATGRIRGIHRALPGRHEAVVLRGTALTAAELAFAGSEAEHAKGRLPIESVICSQALLTSQQRGLIAAVKAYNCDIAEYVMSVADLGLPDEQFAAMLIPSPAPWSPQPAGVLPANATTVDGGPISAPGQPGRFSPPPTLSPSPPPPR
jgi:hypothetical protein